MGKITDWIKIFEFIECLNFGAGFWLDETEFLVDENERGSTQFYEKSKVNSEKLNREELTGFFNADKKRVLCERAFDCAIEGVEYGEVKTGEEMYDVRTHYGNDVKRLFEEYGCMNTADELFAENAKSGERILGEENTLGLRKSIQTFYEEKRRFMDTFATEVEEAQVFAGRTAPMHEEAQAFAERIAPMHEEAQAFAERIAPVYEEKDGNCYLFRNMNRFQDEENEILKKSGLENVMYGRQVADGPQVKNAENEDVINLAQYEKMLSYYPQRTEAWGQYAIESREGKIEKNKRKKIIEAGTRKEAGGKPDIRIEMHNVNNVQNSADIDEISDMLTNKLCALMQKSAEGFYM